MNEQDKRAVEGMARCGIELEGLKAMFPQFPKDEIKEIYDRIKGIKNEPETDISLKMNCS